MILVKSRKMSGCCTFSLDDGECVVLEFSDGEATCKDESCFDFLRGYIPRILESVSIVPDLVDESDDEDDIPVVPDQADFSSPPEEPSEESPEEEPRAVFRVKTKPKKKGKKR